MPAPRIIITLAGEHLDCASEKLFLRTVYANAIEAAGGTVIFVGRTKDDEGLDDIISIADGLLLPGGVDVHPERYGEKPSSLCGSSDAARDQTEIALLKRAFETNTPVLGICRGMQVMNIFMGGTLFQDVATEFSSEIKHDYDTETPRDKTVHNIRIEANTILCRMLGQSTIAVNSFHHQGIKTLGNNLRPNAYAPDELIEGIEHSSHPFFVGVEWHPEDLHDSPSKTLFAAFIEKATQKRSTRALSHSE